MSKSMLSGGVSLYRDDEKLDHFVVIPSNEDGSIQTRVDMEKVLLDLASQSLELIADDEIPWELTEQGWRAWVANVAGIEVAVEVNAA